MTDTNRKDSVSVYESRFPDNPITPERLSACMQGKLSLQELHDIKADQLLAIAQIGESMLANGKMHIAASIFEGLTALNPRLASFHTVLGSIYQRQGEFTKSIEEYTRAIEQNGRDVAALTNRGEIYLQLGRLEEASRDLLRVIDLEKDSPPEEKSPMGKRAIVLALALRSGVKDAGPPARDSESAAGVR
jgi:tetratricopeptide (TPR) repeat protein